MSQSLFPNPKNLQFQFEERKYEGGKKWVSHKKSFKVSNEKEARSDMFMSLFGYITGKNATCKYFGVAIKLKTSFEN